MEAGLVGYDYFSPHNIVPIPDTGLPQNLAGLAGSLAVINGVRGALQTELNRMSADMVDKFGVEVALLLAEPIAEYGSFLEWFEEHFDSGAAGQSGAFKSRLIGEEALNGNGDPEAIVDALLAATSPPLVGMSMFLLGGKGVNEAKPRGGSNAVNPGWRKALVHSSEYHYRVKHVSQRRYELTLLFSF